MTPHDVGATPVGMTPNAQRFQKHCPGCFQHKGAIPVCPHCGYDESIARSPLFLTHGIILGGQYRVGRVLGRPGGFGITYLGWDINLQQRVAIKEYLPREIATRIPDSSDVTVHTSDDRRGFEFGKEQFLREARIVAKLDHANIVRVRNFFNANRTAYLVMDYYEGMSLGDYLGGVRDRLEPELAVPLVRPILEGLQYVHERGLVHRDLKPHNIYLAAIGRPIVLDFGAARQAAGDRVQSLSVVLTEGYAPLEQYQRRAVQGPWTDVYGIAATLYRMIVGVAPPIALDRIGRDPVEDGGWSAVPADLMPALRKGLAVRPSDRYQSASEFRAALDNYKTAATAAGVMPDAFAGTSRAARPRVVMAAAPATPPLPERRAAATAPPREPLLAAPPAAPLRAAPPPVVSAGPALGVLATEAAPPVVPRPAEGYPLLSPASAETPPPAATERLAPKLPDPMPLPPPTGHPLANPTPESFRQIVGGDGKALFRRAEQAPPAPPPPSSRRGMVVAVLVVLAAALVGYVLLNPPGGKRKPVVTAVPAPAPAPAAPVAAPAPAVERPALPAMIGLPAGEVRLVEAVADAAAVPASRDVRVRPFKISATEVTVAQFRDFITRTGYTNPRWQNYPCESAGGRLPEWDNPGYAQTDDFPVVCVNWSDANAYAQWISRETGQGFRLPTEAEWEYAARAGTTTRFWWGSEFNPGMAACQSCPPQVPTQPAAVQSFPQNAFGLFEMLGNVREWTCSMHDRYETGAALQCGTPVEESRVAVRGGSWQEGGDALASGHRDAFEPYRRNVWTGFRLVQDLRGQPAENPAPSPDFP